MDLIRSWKRLSMIEEVEEPAIEASLKKKKKKKKKNAAATFLLFSFNFLVFSFNLF